MIEMGELGPLDRYRWPSSQEARCRDDERTDPVTDEDAEEDGNSAELRKIHLREEPHVRPLDRDQPL